MPVVLTYLDQNALINLGRKSLASADFREKIETAIKSGTQAIVVSSWHLIEIANTTQLHNAIKLADFMDSLQPSWLLEKFDITRLEVHEDFYRFAGLNHPIQKRVVTRSAVIAALSKEKDDPKFDIPSRNFVEQWINHPEQLEAMKKSTRDNVDALLGMRQAVKDGKVTDAVMKETNRVFLRKHAPTFTPAGLEIPRQFVAEYTERANVNSIPTMVLETAISNHEWNAQGGADRNTMIDKLHLIPALPYVDEIVSDDKFFHRIYPIAQMTGHVRAKLLMFDEYLKRF
jgi:hypothetical protein